MDPEKAVTTVRAENPENQPKPGGIVRDGDYSGAVAKNDPKEIALVKKLDRRMMPALSGMYFINFLDRNAIAHARFDGMEKDLKLVGSQYLTAISIFFVGYLLMQIPSNTLLSSNTVRPSIYIGGCMAVWAVLAACTSLVQNYTALVTIRFFLGFLEAPFYPGALYLLSIFYTRKEVAARISVLYGGGILGTACSGPIAVATFSAIGGAQGLAGWRWLFIIEGVLAFSFAVSGMYLLPDRPGDTWWLTEEERTLASERIERDTVGHAADMGIVAGLKEALKEPMLYVFCFMQNMHLSACSFNNFFPTVVAALGFGTNTTLALTCPPYVVAGIVQYCIGLSSGKYNERTWHITGCMGAALVGFIISCVTMNPVARYIACFLFASGAYAVNSVILGWVTATLGQTKQKKAISLGTVNVIANASYVYTAYLYPKADGPKYLTAMVANSGFAFATIVTAWALRTWLKKRNKQLKLSNPDAQVFFAY